MIGIGSLTSRVLKPSKKLSLNNPHPGAFQSFDFRLRFSENSYASKQMFIWEYFGKILPKA
jgi:hypothetical protein